MPSEDIVISSAQLCKTFRLFSHPGDRIRQFLSLGLRRYHREFTALDNVSLDIRRGESVGIIGPNGSGKSTLLQLICGIIKPSRGSIEIRGRVSALLELGAGFNPEFTGRENVYFQGAILGLDRQAMDERFDAIAAFADIGEFIDQPVRTYSSGMFVRLAFAVAAHVDPDILVVDEALAVGDALFQKRCHARIRELQGKGVTLILVSHDAELIRSLTDRALVLDHGTPLYWGETPEATYQYRKLLSEREAQRLTSRAPSILATDPGHATTGFGIGGAVVQHVLLRDADGVPCTVFRPGERMECELSVRTLVPLDRLNLSLVIRSLQGTKIYSWGTFNQDIAIWSGLQSGPVFWDRSFEEGQDLVVTFSLIANLGAGTYEVQGVASRELERQFGSQQILHWRQELASFRIDMDARSYGFGGLCDLQGKVRFDD